MNDVNINVKKRIATMSTNSFVAVVCCSGKFSCDCSVFDLLKCKQPQEDVECPHISFWKEYITPNAAFLVDPVSKDDGLLLQKLKAAFSDRNVPVVRLDNDAKSHRLSVVTSDVPQHQCLVMLYENRLSCTAGICRSKKGNTKKRLVRRLGDKTDCVHMSILNDNRAAWDFLISSGTDDAVVSRLKYSLLLKKATF